MAIHSNAKSNQNRIQNLPSVKKSKTTTVSQVYHLLNPIPTLVCWMISGKKKQIFLISICTYTILNM